MTVHAGRRFISEICMGSEQIERQKPEPDNNSGDDATDDLQSFCVYHVCYNLVKLLFFSDFTGILSSLASLRRLL